MRRNYCVWDGEAAKDAYKRCGTFNGVSFFVLLFLGDAFKGVPWKEAMDGEEEQNQKGRRRRKVWKIGKKDGGLVYKGRKNNHG